MLKFMAAVRRLDHISHDELVHAWEHIHAPHVCFAGQAGALSHHLL